MKTKKLYMINIVKENIENYKIEMKKNSAATSIYHT